MEELIKGSTPPQLDFLTSGQNVEPQNRIMWLRIDQDSIDFLAFLLTKICKQLLLRNKLKTNIETGNNFLQQSKH